MGKAVHIYEYPLNLRKLKEGDSNCHTSFLQSRNRQAALSAPNADERHAGA